MLLNGICIGEYIRFFSEVVMKNAFLGLWLNFRTVHETRDSDSNHESMDSDSRPAGLGLESRTLELGLDSRYAGLGLGKRWTVTSLLSAVADVCSIQQITHVGL
jgi:hypothetical protein